jgi:hypothetical protein
MLTFIKIFSINSGPGGNNFNSSPAQRFARQAQF